jgi:CopG family nickel-responsive transcriptional regulator
MAELSRTGVSIDSALLERFDRFIESQGYANCSEALRDLISDESAGVVTLCRENS